jgi:hypothetical protein
VICLGLNGLFVGRRDLARELAETLVEVGIPQSGVPLSQLGGRSGPAGASAVMKSSSSEFRVRVGQGSNRRARVQGVGVFGGTGPG